MSEVKVNKISPRSGTTVTLGDSGDTFTIPSGATINNQGTATNFGATGSASWTTTVKTNSDSGFTAVAGEGYFLNTTSGTISVNLPAGSAGAVVAFKDYLNTFDTNEVTLVPKGSDKNGGVAANKVLRTEGIAVTLIFIDSTQGWLVTDDGLQSSVQDEVYSADMLVVAGGGGGGGWTGGGGGAGGFRTSTQNFTPTTVYTVTVGDGGASRTGSNSPSVGNDGSDSSISGSGLTTITSTGGGGGGGNGTDDATTNGEGQDGGSGGGGGGYYSRAAGSGDTPSTTPSQGNNGSASNATQFNLGGGGGASAPGGSTTSTTAGNGGAGTASSITGSSVTYAGGGGGHSSHSLGGTGGAGGGGNGVTGIGSGTSGTANTGGGGGGNRDTGTSGAGGKGVVIISVPTASYSSTTTGSPTVTTSGSNTIMQFNSSGSYTG